MRVISRKLKYARKSIAIAIKNSVGSCKICRTDNMSKISNATKAKTTRTILTVPLMLSGVANT